MTAGSLTTSESASFTLSVVGEDGKRHDVRLDVSATLLPAPDAGPTVSINVKRSDVAEARHAPEGVVFEAVPSGFAFRDFGPSPLYDAAFHEIHYEWDFGDGRAPWTAPRLPAGFNAPSKGYGRKPSHVYTAPGTYTVTCTARQIVALDPLELRVASSAVSVSVGDVDNVFDAQTTLVVDFGTNGAPFDGAPPGLTAADAAEFAARMTALRGSGRRFRVRLKRGEDYRPFAAFRDALRRDHTADLMRLDAWGDPADPKPKVPHFGIERPPRGAAFIALGLHQEAEYDPDTDTYPDSGTDKSAYYSDNELSGPGHYVFHDCRIEKIETAFYFRHLVTDPWGTLALFADDIETRQLRRYLVFAEDYSRDYISVRGCSYDDSGMLSDSTGGVTFQGPVRVRALADCAFDGLDLFTAKGWSAGAPWSDGTTGAAAQPAMRVGANPARDEMPFDPIAERAGTYTCRCVFEGAGALWSKRATGSTAAAQAVNNDVVERCIFLVGPQGNNFGELAGGGITFRANLLIKPDTSEYGLREVFDAPLDPKDEAMGITADLLAAHPIQVYGNTVAATYDDATVAFIGGPLGVNFPTLDNVGDAFRNIVEENNVFYAPSLETRIDRVAFTPDTTVLFPPRYAGRRYAGPPDNGVLQTRFATPQDAFSLYAPTDPAEIPQATNPAAVPVIDLAGQLVADAPRQGAITAAPQTSQTSPLPTGIGLLARYDASDAATITTGQDGTVREWANAHAGPGALGGFIAPAGQELRTGIVTQNGLNVLRAEGLLEQPLVLTELSLAPPLHVFMAFRQSNRDGDPNLMDRRYLTLATAARDRFATHGPLVSYYVPAADIRSEHDRQFTDGPHVVAFETDATGRALLCENGEVRHARAGLGTAPWNLLYALDAHVGGRPMDADICEIVICAGVALSAEQWNGVHRYLAEKWALPPFTPRA